eukprot:5090874-Prorocentrum_lima.AAC.1
MRSELATEDDGEVIGIAVRHTGPIRSGTGMLKITLQRGAAHNKVKTSMPVATHKSLRRDFMRTM